MNEYAAKEITMTRLEDWLVEDLSHKNLNPGQGRAHPEFHLLDRQRLAQWQRKLCDQIEQVRDLLLPINPNSHDEET